MLLPPQAILNDTQPSATLSESDVPVSPADLVPLSTISAPSLLVDWCCQIDCRPDDSDQAKPLSVEQQQQFQGILQEIKRSAEAKKNNCNSDICNRLLLGPPGSGKTEIVARLRKRLQEQKLDVVCCAPTGSAAVLLQGRTGHGLLIIPVFLDSDDKGKPLQILSFEQLNTRRKLLLENHVAVLVIDEISMVSATILHHYHSRLCEILACDLPFGGIPIVAMGDFFQFPPVGALTLYEEVLLLLKCVQNASAGVSLAAKGAQLFRNFKIFQLSTQQRSLDPVHTAKVLKLRDISVQFPVDKTLVESIPDLRREDYDTDPQWYNAIVAVTNNQERLSLNVDLIARFARRTGQTVLKWRYPLKDKYSKCLDEERTDAMYSRYPELWCYFCTGAKAFTTKNFNVERGIANGTQVVLHSISYENEELTSHWSNLCNTAEPGSILELPFAPNLVYVSIPHSSEVTWQDCERTAANDVILPLRLGGISSKLAYGTIRKKRKAVATFSTYGLDLAFAVTYHKLQGLTCDRLVLQLNKNPTRISNMKYEGFVVALSRVRRAAHLRKLPLIPGGSFEHLYKLKIPEKLKLWLSAVTTHGNWNDMKITSVQPSSAQTTYVTNNSRKRKRVSSEPVELNLIAEEL